MRLIPLFPLEAVCFYILSIRAGATDLAMLNASAISLIRSIFV